MEKIPTLFTRDPTTHRVTDVVTEGCRWVVEGHGEPTRKWDGTAARVHNGRLWKRYTLKRGRSAPTGTSWERVDGVIRPVAVWQPVTGVDLNTGKQEGWVLVDTHASEDKYFREAWGEASDMDIQTDLDGTYELVGPRVNGGREPFDKHVLIPHGQHPLDDCPRLPTFFGMRDYLASRNIEGVVWWHPDGRMVKLKGRDYGLTRPGNQ